jgi:hypothetical protein
MSATATPSPTLGWTWSDVDPAAHFAADYAEARTKFLAACASRSLAVERHVHPSARGPAGEELSVDVAVLGDAAGPALLVTSGTHGVEGFCGSGCQVGLLADDAFLASLRQHGVALLLVHGLNPFGFAHLARTTEDNVDLNRNFRDFGALAVNEAYGEVHGFMVPERWPPPPENEARLMGYEATRGAPALQQAVTGGQSDHPDGLFFAGVRPAWSQDVLRDVLRRHAASRPRLGWIDIHTGLGPSGHGEKIFAGPDDAAMLDRARRWWGADVTSIYEGTSTSARVSGMLCMAALDECPATEYTGIALEYGTLSYLDVMNALRARQWLTNHAHATATQRDAILRGIRDAFYVDTPAWKAMVFAQARAAALQAVISLEEAPA